jgi:hypothetical protein
MLAGTVSVCVLLASAKVAPPAPAGCVKVTVQVDVAPEARLAGVQDTEIPCVGVVNITEAVCELPFNVAVTTAVCVLEKAPAVAANVAVVTPAGMDTVAGTLRAEEPLARATATPPEPAGWVTVTAHVEVAPLVRLAALHERELNTVGATSVTAKVCELPFKVAFTTAACPLEIVPAVAVNVAPIAFAATDTVVGTVSD